VTNQTDSLIDEVTEAVRRDRLFAFMRRYAWIAVLAVIALVGGATYTEWRRASEAAAAQAVGDSVYAALQTEDAAARAEALAALDLGGAAVAPAALLQAGSLAEAGETARAAEVLAAVAADPGFSTVWRDLAALKRVLLLDAAALDPEGRIQALAPLTGPGAPFRVIAQELTAYAMAQSGDREGAVAMLTALTMDQQASDGLRQRVLQMLVVLDPGEAEG